MAAHTETRISGFAWERVREAMRLSEGGAEVEAWDRVQFVTGASVGARGRGTIGGCRPLGVGI